MIWTDKLMVAGWVLAVIVIQAYVQAGWFAKGKTISHNWQAVIFGITCLLPLFAIIYAGHSLRAIYGVPIIAITERAALFDGILNYFRKPRRSWWYNGNPEIPDNSTQSWFDRLENRLSAFWLKVLKIGYIAVFLTILIII